MLRRRYPPHHSNSRHKSNKQTHDMRRVHRTVIHIFAHTEKGDTTGVNFTDFGEALAKSSDTYVYNEFSGTTTLSDAD